MVQRGLSLHNFKGQRVGGETLDAITLLLNSIIDPTAYVL